jgi:hypothetical protein
MLLLAVAVAGGYLVVVWKLDQMWQGLEEHQRALRKLITEADERTAKRIHDLANAIARIDDESTD